MRKSLKLMGMAAMVLLLAVSCKKEKQDEGRKTVFTAGIEQGTGKTYVHDDGSQYGLYWSDGDAIKVNGVECALKSGAGKTSGTFEGDVEEKEKYYAVYPSSAGFAGTTATFNIPETQAFADGTFASQTAPMVAESGSEKSFTFTNLCGILDIRLYGTDVTVNKVVLTATGASIAGEYTYDFTNSEAGLVQAGAKGDGNNTIEMDDCDKVIGTTEIAPTSFVFVLPPAELTELKIDVYANDGVMPALTKTIDNLTITAGQAYCNTTPYKVEAEPVAYQGLCFTAVEAGATVKLVEKSLYGKMNLREVSLTPGFQYSSDGTNWCDYTIGKDITLNNEGDKVYFRRESKANTFSTPTTGNFMQFVTNVNDEKQIVTDDEKKIAASGNIMSLLDPDCEVTEFDSQDGFACFYMLFNGCTSLTTAPVLPALLGRDEELVTVTEIIHSYGKTPILAQFSLICTQRALVQRIHHTARYRAVIAGGQPPLKQKYILVGVDIAEALRQCLLHAEALEAAAQHPGLKRIPVRCPRERDRTQQIVLPQAVTAALSIQAGTALGQDTPLHVCQEQ